MSYTQQQIINKASHLSEIDAKLVLEFMERLITLGTQTEQPPAEEPQNEKMLALQRLNQMIGGYSPDFDPEKELLAALDEKYGVVN